MDAKRTWGRERFQEGFVVSCPTLFWKGAKTVDKDLVMVLRNTPGKAQLPDTSTNITRRINSNRGSNMRNLDIYYKGGGRIVLPKVSSKSASIPKSLDKVRLYMEGEPCGWPWPIGVQLLPNKGVRLNSKRQLMAKHDWRLKDVAQTLWRWRVRQTTVSAVGCLNYK